MLGATTAAPHRGQPTGRSRRAGERGESANDEHDKGSANSSKTCLVQHEGCVGQQVVLVQIPIPDSDLDPGDSCVVREQTMAYVRGGEEYTRKTRGDELRTREQVGLGRVRVIRVIQEVDDALSAHRAFEVKTARRRQTWHNRLSRSAASLSPSKHVRWVGTPHYTNTRNKHKVEG